MRYKLPRCMGDSASKRTVGDRAPVVNDGQRPGGPRGKIGNVLCDEHAVCLQRRVSRW